MSTIKRSKRQSPFVQIDKRALQDKNLSWKAKGLLSYLLSLPDDWQVYVNELKEHSTDGRDSTANALKELIKVGYVSREKKRSEGGRFEGYEYIVYESPIQPQPETPKTDKPETGNPSTVNPKTDKPNSENPELLIKEDTNTHKTDKENGDKQNLSPSLSKISEVKEILNYLTQKSGNRFRLGKKFKDSEKYKLIAARLQDYSVDDLKAVIDVKSKEWAESAEWCKRLVPKTLFRASNFERYMDEVENLKPQSVPAQQETTGQSEIYAKSIFEKFCYFYKESFENKYMDKGMSVSSARAKAENDILHLEPNPLDPKDSYSAKIDQLKKQFPNLLSRAYNALK